MAAIITTNGEIKPVAPKNGTDFQLDELQGIVGGYIEIVTLWTGGIMCLDEEGKLKSKDINFKATEIFRKGRGATKDFIVGDVLICDKEQIK